MRIKAVKLYEKHYAGKPAALAEGKQGVPVYPIAIGRYRKVNLQCGAQVLPAESQTTKIVCAISEYHARVLNNPVHGSVLYHRTTYPSVGTRMAEQFARYYSDSALKTLRDRHGFTENGPQWGWTLVVLSSSQLTPANEYESVKSITDEYMMEIDVLEERVQAVRKDRQACTTSLINTLQMVAHDGGVDIVHILSPRMQDPFTHDTSPNTLRVNGANNPLASIPWWVDKKTLEVHGTVAVRTTEYITRVAKRRRLAVSSLLPALGNTLMVVTVKDLIDAIGTAKQPVPPAYKRAVEAYVEAVDAVKEAEDAWKKKAECAPPTVRTPYLQGVS